LNEGPRPSNSVASRSAPQATADTVRVLIADDQAVFRRGLFVVLSTEDNIEVVAEAENGEEAIAKTEELAPDVVLMDVRMPRVNGIEAARQIREISPSTKILMLTVSDEEDDLYQAIKAGANGYLLKEISVEEVADAIRAVAQGQSLISPSMASKLLNEFNALAKRAEERDHYLAPRLTSRELDVLRQVARGMSNREIADTLFISENTVKNHVRNILEKLHLHSRMEAVMYAMRERLFDIRATDESRPAGRGPAA
jgi:DNA-binding NarL/FixJ family response regulator